MQKFAVLLLLAVAACAPDPAVVEPGPDASAPDAAVPSVPAVPEPIAPVPSSSSPAPSTPSPQPSPSPPPTACTTHGSCAMTALSLCQEFDSPGTAALQAQCEGPSTHGVWSSGPCAQTNAVSTCAFDPAPWATGCNTFRELMYAPNTKAGADQSCVLIGGKVVP